MVEGNSVSPLMVTMMLESHWRPSGEWPINKSPAHNDAASWLIRNGYVYMSACGHSVTNKGARWIEYLTKSPEAAL